MNGRVAVIVSLLTMLAFNKSRAVYQVPADVPITAGTRQTAVCGPCCENDVFCGTVDTNLFIGDPAKELPVTLIAKGTNMTCMQRSRNAYGAGNSQM